MTTLKDDNDIPNDEESLYEWFWKQYPNEQPPDHIPPNKYNEYVGNWQLDWNKKREAFEWHLDLERVRQIMSPSTEPIPNEDDEIAKETDDDLEDESEVIEDQKEDDDETEEEEEEKEEEEKEPDEG